MKTIKGTEARRSDGTLVIRTLDPQTGVLQRESLFKPGEGTNYIIDLPSKKAVGTPMKIGCPANTDKASDHKSIEGLSATAYNMYNSQTKLPGGKVWVIDGTNITAEIEVNLPNGGSYTKKLHNLHAGQEPPAGMFAIPVGVEIPGTFHPE